MFTLLVFLPVECTRYLLHGAVTETDFMKGYIFKKKKLYKAL